MIAHRARSSLRQAAALALFLLFVQWHAAVSAAAAEATMPAAEWMAIKRVIGAQLAAFKSGDDEQAFAQASPGIRAQFGNAANFMTMVRGGYAALLSPRYTEFLDGAVIDGRVIQPLRVIAFDNTVVVALYTMERQDDGRWKIAGCAIAPSTVRAI